MKFDTIKGYRGNRFRGEATKHRKHFKKAMQHIAIISR